MKLVFALTAAGCAFMAFGLAGLSGVGPLDQPAACAEGFLIALTAVFVGRAL